MRIGRAIKFGVFGAAVLALFAVAPLIYKFISYYNALDQEVAARFAGKRWTIPSLVYSDSTTIYPGLKIDDIGLFQRLARLNYHRVDPAQVRIRGEYSFDKEHGRLDLFLHSFHYPYSESPGEQVALRVSPVGTVIEIADAGTHKPLDAIELEPELLGAIFQGDWEQRRIVPLAEMPPGMVYAVMAAEDHRFYEHHGIDLVRTLKAAWVDFNAGHVVQGGSTLTQQLVKNFFLTSKRDWHRKMQEALMAYIVERRYSKDQILENYLNDIYLGQRGQEGIYGIWEAAQFYFSKEPRDLSIAEMATLAGMIRSPNRYNPIRHADSVRLRRNEVLGAMLQDGYIGKAAYDEAVVEPVHAREPYLETNDAPYFVDYVKRELAERYPAEVLDGEGLRVFTTLDVHMQKQGETAVDENLEKLEAQHKSLRRKERSEELQSCLLAIEPQTGKIRAMVGGRDYREGQFNHVTQAHRQPGSAFKPVTYLAALDETMTGQAQYLPTSYIEDTPFTWNYGTMSWTPRNYKNRYFGRVTLEFALEESLNSATSRLADAVGLDRVIAMAGKLGFGDLPAYPSIILGGIEVTPIALARMYAILANEGEDVPFYAVTAVVDQKGHPIEGHELKAEQVLSPELAYTMDFMLEQVINHGTGEGARKAGFRLPAAGKTGTTNDSNDAWFAGFTPNLLAVVWTGFDQKEALGLTGAEASLPAWTSFMKAATASRPELDFAAPAGVVTAKIDPLSGDLAGPYCPTTVIGVFPKALAPTEVCPFHKSAASVENTAAPGAEGAAATNTDANPEATLDDSPND
ncbi:MAG TPA: PBP1A family penicillin-binding protein [Candidatus Binataceae bacterium]|nr:PBP1A family penicillin-binding protein [Candidatus Binataceae bacterium]